MNSTRKLVVPALALVAVVFACESDPTKPPAPEPPPQIGYSQTYTRSSTCLPGSDAYAFLTLSNGEFWVGTQAGLARFASIKATTRGQDDVVNEINGLPHPKVTSMVEYDSKVYVGTWGGGLGIYDIAGDAWTQIRPEPIGLTDGFIAEIAVSPTENLLYLATNDGVFTYNPMAGIFAHISTVDDDLDEDDIETPALQALVSTVEVMDDLGVVQRWYGPRVEVRLPKDKLYLHGITVSKSATKYKYTKTNSGLVEPNVNDIYFDAVSNTFWVAYVTKGISQVDVNNATWKNYTLVDGLPSNTVYSITRAGDGNSGTTMWAATQSGLARLGAGRWQGYGVSGGLPSNRVRKVFSDDGIRLWVGFVNAGAVRIR